MKITNTKYSVTSPLAASLPSVWVALSPPSYWTERRRIQVQILPRRSYILPLPLRSRRWRFAGVHLQTPSTYKRLQVIDILLSRVCMAFTPREHTVYPTSWRCIRLCVGKVQTSAEHTASGRSPTSDWRFSLAAVQDLAKDWRAYSWETVVYLGNFNCCTTIALWRWPLRISWILDGTLALYQSETLSIGSLSPAICTHTGFPLDPGSR